MSYCRWSSDDHQCDVYVWEDVSGYWRTEVAGRRITWDVPLPPKINLPVGAANTPERRAWIDAHMARGAAINALMDDETAWHYTDLPAPEGGTSYEHSSPGECADNLERLRAQGFNVPQYAIDSLRQEAAE